MLFWKCKQLFYIPGPFSQKFAQVAECLHHYNLQTLDKIKNFKAPGEPLSLNSHFSLLVEAHFILISFPKVFDVNNLAQIKLVVLLKSVISLYALSDPQYLR